MEDTKNTKSKVADNNNLAIANAEGDTLASVNLATPTGDGGLSVTVDAFGGFGSNAVGNAFYDPVGSISQAGTSYLSGVALRVGNTGSRTFLATSGLNSLANPGFDTNSSTNAQSNFSQLGLDFSLDQTVSETFENGDRTGSLLNQTYTITNPGTSPISFELVRYLDGDLRFDGSITDGGGLITNGDRQILFETDTAGESDTSSTFVGITGEGGSTATPGRFEIDGYSGLRSNITDGTALDDIIQGDSDSDQFVDAGAGYDLSLGLSNSFTLAPGESTTYTTSTIFGSGTPEEASVNDITGTAGGDSSLSGTSGRDSITGRQGRDILTGGAESDRFVYISMVDGGDIIEDFAVGEDQIVLTDVLDSLGYTGSDPIADGYVLFGASGADTYVQIDPDGAGSGKARNFILVENVIVDDLNDTGNFVF